jgi:flagellar basal body-associated protein FliL
MKKILGLLPKIGLAIVVLMMAGITFFMAYIMFAPDTMPKPFYLVYSVADPQAAISEQTTPAENAPAEKAVQEPHTAQDAPAESAPVASLEIRPGQGLMVDTGSKIVNLIDPTGRKYLRVGIVLEFAPTDLKYYTMASEEKAAYITTFEEDVKSKLPIVNNTIITLLASKTFESVYTAEGKENLRKDIMNTINIQLPEYRVIFVYFTEFVVQ